MTEPTPPIPIRMSAAGHCPRRQAYTALGYTISNPPDRQAQNRMALGDAAENILIANLTADGWEVTDTRAVPGGAQLELNIDRPLPMTGHPDGICRHPIHTKGRWVTLECKSMSDERRRRVETDGIAAVYPEYLAQVALYSRVLYEQRRVTHPHCAVFAYMDREGHNPAPERVKWDQALEKRLWQQLTDTWDQIQSERLPPRPYPPDDPKCRYCPFYTTCQQQEPPPRARPHQINDPSVIAAAEQWLTADRQRRQATAQLRAAATGREQGIIAGPVQASWFYPPDRDYYDPETLRRLVPGDLLQQCRRHRSTGPAFWIRPRR